MPSFEANIQNIYRDKGKAWLEQLPKLVTNISSRLGLRDLVPVSNLTYNYVLSGFQDDTPVILKLGLDSQSLSREAFALKCFAGFGAVKAMVEEEGLLLLERATPGIALKNFFPDRGKDAIQITCKVIKKLHQAGIPKDHNFPHIKNWLSALDKDWDLPTEYLQKAKSLRDQLIASSSPAVLLHGDLHHDNILQNGRAWVVIDPKGVIGESAYEVAAFIRNPIPELIAHENIAYIIQSRIDAFAKNLNISPNRIAEWCFVQVVLSWVWTLEDGCDTKYWEQMAKVLNSMK